MQPTELLAKKRAAQMRRNHHVGYFSVFRPVRYFQSEQLFQLPGNTYR
jgi:hypothetical protein